MPARVGQAPARELLDRIVRSPADPAPDRVHARRVGWRLRAGVLAAVAAVAVGAVLTLPELGSEPAYASWTPTPSPLAAADRSDFTARCTAAVATEWGYRAPETRVLGERRGDYAYMSVVAPGWTSTCFRDRDGSVRTPSVLADPAGAAKLGRKGVEMQGWAQLRTSEGYCRLMAGQVGSEVVGVDVTVRGGSGERVRDVRATLQDGYFLAWYPEGIDDASSNRTTVTLRLAGGGTIADLSARDLHDAPVLD